MTTARQFLDLVKRYEQFKLAGADPERLLRDLPEEQLVLLLQTVAVTFTQLRREATRRGIWDDLVQKGMGMKKKDLVP